MDKKQHNENNAEAPAKTATYPLKKYPLHLCFTDSFTEPSRTFTDAGNSTLYFLLHGDLHGTFTDLHGCTVFKKCRGKSENLLMRSFLNLHERDFIAEVIYIYIYIYFTPLSDFSSQA